MAVKNDSDIIDIGKLVRKVWSRRKLFLYWIWPITIVVSSLLIICVPRTYTSSAKLAPEMESMMSGGAFGSLASTFGLNLGDMQTSDAISPFLYPDLMEDNGFVTGLFGIHVKDSEGEIDTDYYTYLKKHQKSAWWSRWMGWVRKLLTIKKESTGGGGDGGFNPYYLSKDDDGVCGAIRGNVNLGVDKKTGVISINVKAQDRLVCKTVADSVSSRLQEFITDYRTNKARIDVEYYTNLVAESKEKYETAQRNYASFVDSHKNTILQSIKGRENILRNDMDLKYNTYSTLITQLDAARAKLQERTPAFTVLTGASVPLQPSGPRRMLFVLGMLIMVTLAGMLFVVRDDIKGFLVKSDEKAQ